MNRRGFLKGLLATAAIPMIGADLIVRTTGPCRVLDMGGTIANSSVWLVTWGANIEGGIAPEMIHRADWPHRTHAIAA